MAIRTFFLLFFFLTAGPALAQDEPPHHVQIRLMPEHAQVKAGDTLSVAIDEAVEPGWHTYWINPGDSGEAPEIAWTLPSGSATRDVRFPVPEKITIGPLVSYGYQDHVTLLQDIALPKDLPPGPLKFSAAITVLVCKDICIPETGTYDLELNSETAQDNSALVAGARATTVGGVTEWPAVFKEDKDDFVLTVTLPKPDFAASVDKTKAIDILPIDWGAVDNAAPSTAEVQPTVLLIRQKKGDRNLAELDKLRLWIGYTDKTGARRALSFEAKPDPAWKKTQGGTTASSPPVKSDKLPVPLTLARALVLAILGGLVLNLMPCVFPVLSLKTLKLCKLSGGDLKRARGHSLFYTLGILVSFGVLAVLLVVLRGAGQQIGWGFQLQNPAFVLPLSWLLFAIGLSLAGFFEFGAGFANLGGALAQGDGYAASFFTGVLAAIVATPCTAPFMGAAMGYALTQPSAVTVVVLLALGFGLAVPFLLISFLPPLRALLPKPGAWMETFKQFLAFPMFASAAWLAWVFSLQAGPASVMVALSGAVAIAFGLWLLKKTPAAGGGRLLVRALAVVAFFSALAMVPYAGHLQNQTARASDSADWEPFTAKDFAAMESGSDPLFVDMSAAWCITCKVNESTVLNTASVKDMFHTHKVRTVMGDWTNRNPEITAFLMRFGRNGVPLYVYFPLPGADGKRPDPVLLPQILTPGIVERAIQTDEDKR